MFASEAKNLVGMCGHVMPFPPGHYYKDGEFVQYCDIAAVDEVCHDDLETVCKNIREKLIAGVDKRLVADAKVGFLLSGGLPRLRHSGKTEQKADTHLCNRHERGRY